MKEYETEKIKIDDIKLDGDNPNRLDPEMDKRLGQSMKEFGNTQDIVVDKNTMILADGEHRLQKYKKEGLTEIPVKLIPFKSDAHRRAYRQAANKIRGKHTDDLDAQEYMKIIEAGEKDLLKMATGLSISDVEKHLRRQNLLAKEENFDAEEEYKNITNPVAKQGDIWGLGEHRLMCGDAVKEEDVRALMGDTKADMVFTDPPYNVNYGSYGSTEISRQRAKVAGNKEKYNALVAQSKRFPGKTIQNDEMSREDFIKFTDGYLNSIFEFSNGAYYIFMSCKEWGTLMNAFENLGGHWSSTIIWNKSTFCLSRKNYHPKFEPIMYGWKEGNEHYFIDDRKQSDVWEFDKPHNSDLHPTMKPIELCERAINNSSKEEMIVLDLFGGSGSTLIACEKLIRKCRMMEIDPIYCDVIIKRWEEFTNLKAEKIL